MGHISSLTTYRYMYINFPIYEQTNQFQSYPSIVFNGLITYPSCCQSIICNSWSVYSWLFCFLNQHLFKKRTKTNQSYLSKTPFNQNCTEKFVFTNICKIHLPPQSDCNLSSEIYNFDNLTILTNKTPSLCKVYRLMDKIHKSHWIT